VVLFIAVFQGKGVSASAEDANVEGLLGRAQR
jgi:hypothetical protein